MELVLAILMIAGIATLFWLIAHARDMPDEPPLMPATTSRDERVESLVAMATPQPKGQVKKPPSGPTPPSSGGNDNPPHPPQPPHVPHPPKPDKPGQRDR